MNILLVYCGKSEPLSLSLQRQKAKLQDKGHQVMTFSGYHLEMGYSRERIAGYTQQECSAIEAGKTLYRLLYKKENERWKLIRYDNKQRKIKITINEVNGLNKLLKNTNPQTIDLVKIKEILASYEIHTFLFYKELQNEKFTSYINVTTPANRKDPSRRKFIKVKEKFRSFVIHSMTFLRKLSSSQETLEKKIRSSALPNMIYRRKTTMI